MKPTVELVIRGDHQEPFVQYRAVIEVFGEAFAGVGEDEAGAVAALRRSLRAAIQRGSAAQTAAYRLQDPADTLAVLR